EIGPTDVAIRNSSVFFLNLSGAWSMMALLDALLLGPTVQHHSIWSGSGGHFLYQAISQNLVIRFLFELLYGLRSL
ncbi:MAG: hypothetical protein ACKO96_39205, partial [Flammeovirgaceae bacterium]